MPPNALQHIAADVLRRVHGAEQSLEVMSDLPKKLPLVRPAGVVPERPMVVGRKPAPAVCLSMSTRSRRACSTPPGIGLHCADCQEFLAPAEMRFGRALTPLADANSY
jgi:hypothetical protein